MKIISIALAELVSGSDSSNGSDNESDRDSNIILLRDFYFFYFHFLFSFFFIFHFLFFYFLGRAGAKGLAVSFFTDKASKMAGELITILREANQEIPSQLESMRSFGGGGGGRYGGR